ncbi:hypothetical protein [Roseibium sp.]|uniref:hypothetical protein n=1 Tax=Roseibium sp. TaxID=1936156 RepID=UPI003D0A102B
MSVHLTKSLALAIALVPIAAFSQDHGHGSNTAPYAGFETREIKSLSEQDIAELQRGGGWGLALPAELNGHPGPAHLLDLQTELELSAEQVGTITATYKTMRIAAIAAGERLIAAEAAISNAFAQPGLSEETLRSLLAEAGKARTELRFIHLSRHLSTPELLSDAQIQQYNILRGYADDPCTSVPEGHNRDLWRRHNGCD